MDTMEYKGLIVHNIQKFPPNFDYPYVELDELSRYDFDKLLREGIDEIWYWYAVGSYEGSGACIVRRGTAFDAHDMGHCSCYGPVDDLRFISRTMEQLLNDCSAYFRNYISHLLEHIELPDSTWEI